MRILLLATALLPLNAVADCQRGQIESFASFMRAFSQDKRFAMTRTEYPLRLLNHESDARNNTQHLSRNADAELPTMGAYARTNGLQISVSAVRKTDAELRMEKPDTDWLLTYHFVRKGPCWYLRRIEDHSL